MLWLLLFLKILYTRKVMPVRETLIQVITKHCLLFLINSAVSWFSPRLYHKAKVIWGGGGQAGYVIVQRLKFIMSGFKKCINCFLLASDALQSSDKLFFFHNTPWTSYLHCTLYFCHPTVSEHLLQICTPWRNVTKCPIYLPMLTELAGEQNWMRTDL